MLNLISALTSGEDITAVLTQLFALIFVTLCCLAVHESAHAWAANRLGDPTGRLSGRITLNPMAHLSLIGTLCMVLIGFGYAKPVPVNIRNFPVKKRKLYFALTAVAGPISNFIMAIISVILMNIFVLVSYKTGADFAQYASRFFLYVAYYNIALGVFNFLPIPPLDGSRIWTMLLPDRIYYKVLSFERYLVFILLAVFWIGGRFFDIVGTVTYYVFMGMNSVISLLFNLFY